MFKWDSFFGLLSSVNFSSVISLMLLDSAAVPSQSVGSDSFLVTPWAVACQAPLSMEFFRQEYWSG